MVVPLSSWSPNSWQAKQALQQPNYPSAEHLERALAQLSALPPLVTSWEVLSLRSQLAEAAAGKRFVLQGGDCAERFDDCRPASIAAKLKILLQMSLVLIHGSQKPVIRMGRFAGQYAKPRSDDNETRESVTLPSYRGDIVNRSPFTSEDRVPDPDLLLRGYERAALTLNFIRSLVRGGFADLHHPEYWDLEFVRNSPMADEFHRLTAGITESLRFMENVLGAHSEELQWVDFFTCHEALHLHYEQAQTHKVPHREGWFNLSTHFPWIGMRTADPGGAHVEYFRGIENPIGVKVGPSIKSDQLLRLLDILHPHDAPGRLTFIHRLGRAKIEESLPRLLETVKRSGKRVVWICDPMHGNTRTTSSGIKTRSFDDILGELGLAFTIHDEAGGSLGGVHFELTGENVTECVGGTSGITEDGLSANYKSEVDPRLNYEQALEMAFLMVKQIMPRRLRQRA